MIATKLRQRIARATVLLLAAGFIQTGISAPAAHAAPPVKPTISGVTSDASSITVTMVTSNIDATQWRWSLTRRQTFGCDNPYTDGAVQSTGSLSSTIVISGTTEGCRYLIRVAGFNGVIGDYAEWDELAGGGVNGLNIFVKSEAGASTGMTRTPLDKNSAGICNPALSRVNNIDVNYSASGPSGCPVDGFTSYYVGYLKAPYTGAVNFRVSADDGFILNIQGQNVINNPVDTGVLTYNASGSIDMVANEIYRIEAWHHENSAGSAATLFWDWTGSGSTVAVPQASLATDPSVFFGTCPLGLTAQCAAGSAMEIKRATGTNMDGMYWINIAGTPTLVYCIMNSAQGGGGWMMAMKGKNSATTFTYNSSYWVNNTLLGQSSYPVRYSSTDSTRNEDAKYAPFTSLKSNQIMVLYPDYTNGGGAYLATNKSQNGVNYGFSWSETITTTAAGSIIKPWTAYSNGFGGTSWNQGLTGGPTEKPTDPGSTASCINAANTLTYLFLNANRCAFRQVSASWDANETPYSAIGNNLFFTQNAIRFFGINYGASSAAATSQQYKARIGFGWNEGVTSGEDTSNDGEGGIGIYVPSLTTMGAGSYNGCCATQNGVSGTANASSTQMAFELYVRNTALTTVVGNNLRVTSKRLSTLTSGTGFTTPSTNGSNTFRLSPAREGFNIDSATGKITVSEQIPVGDYSMTVTVTDTDGVSGTRATTVQVVSDSYETDTAISFSGSSSLSTSGTFTLTGDQTWEAWVRPTNACSSTQKTIIGSDSFVLLCISGYWNASFRNSAGAWASYQSSQKIVYDAWAHIAVVRSGTTASMYVNNSRVTMLVSSVWSDSWSVPSVYATASTFYFGGYGAGQYYSGQIDEVKIWDEARTLTQIVTDMHAPPSFTSANLLAYWDFNDGAGNAAISRAQRSDSTFNLSPTSGQYVSVATTTTSGPYTVVTVPRTLISTSGGWRAPDSITALFAMVVGGGGGGGGGYEGGGGGGGGVLQQRINVTPKSVYAFKVGMGGRGAYNPTRALSGDTSTAFGLSAAGGGSGASEMNVSGANTQYPATSGGSGGGGVWGSFMTGASGIAGQGSNGGSSLNLENPNCSPSVYAGAGGGGASSTGTGAAPTCTKGGNGGNGATSLINSNVYGGGGAGSLRSSTTLSGRGLSTTGGGGSSAYVSGAMPGATDGAESGQAGFGGGGGAGLSTDGATGFGGDGGSGVIIFQFITALKPTFTSPTNTTINVGMVESFSVNIATDSATSVLTRTFRWESSTTGVNGTFSMIKQGTGANNAFFSWTPPDTSTTGSQYVYRVVVTDSDTAGLFIQDTSTSVFATINGRLVLSGKSSVSKTVNISKTETFTVTGGTSTFRYTLLPDGPNFWLDTTTALTPRLRILDTATVGTYYETLTVTDSVSATSVIPLTIKVSPPPSFSANAEQVDSSTVLYYDAGNTSSYPGTGNTWTDISGLTRHASMNASISSSTFIATTQTSCKAPSFSSENIGILTFSNASTNKTCAITPNLGILTKYTLQTWFKIPEAQNIWTAMVTNPWAGAGKQLNFSLFWTSTTSLSAGVFDGANWFYTTGMSVPLNTWTLATVTFDGNFVTLYLDRDGASQSSAVIDASTRSAFTTANMNGILAIGRRWDGDDYFSGSIASLRIYDRVLSTSEINQNYNATKGRFTNAQNKQAQTGKYGTKYSDTFTVTAGSETITAAWSNTSLTRIKWDTSTARSLVLSSQESLTPGTYYDTVTVTDIYGSFTRIPLTYTIAKADTVTVWIETPTAVSYTGTNAIFPTTLRVSGLVSSDTGTAIASIRYRPGGGTCATGGVCSIGDIGPGGGIVFITPSTTGGNGRYFEAAPFTWAGSDELGTADTYCSNGNLNLGATNVGIGWGETNTNLAKNGCLGGAIAKVNNFNTSNTTGYSDWFVPSTNELIELAKVRTSTGLLALGSTWTIGRYGYWSSTEVSASVQASLVTSSWSIGGTGKSDGVNNLVRPVRMFTPCWTLNSCSALASTSKPVNAGVYAMNAETLTISSGDLNNYVSIRYETTTVTINRIAQTVQQGSIYNAAYPDTFTLFMLTGSGTGAVSYTISSGGTASGCATDYKKVSVTSVGTCNIQVVRLGDRNFLSDTSTSYVYFVNFVFNQPTPTVGSGPNIALTGINTVQLEATTAPTISGLSASSGAVGSTITITGAGFYFADPSKLSIKFWRNIEAVAYTINSDTSVTVTVPTGATTGRILITTPNGQFASSTFTVTP